MSMVIKKRQLVMATLILALGSAVFINWYYTKPQNDLAAQEAAKTTQAVTQKAGNLGEAMYVNKTGTAAQEFFAAAALKREEAHAEAQEMLRAVIEDPDSPELAVSEATDALTALSETIKRETDLQTLITAKTGSDCLVTLDDMTAQVVVEPEILNDAVTLQIKEILISQTEITGENIVITEATG